MSSQQQAVLNYVIYVFSMAAGGIEPGLGAEAEAAGIEASTSSIRVGRWMSSTEHKEMLSTGRVQAPHNGAGATHVTVPPNPAGFTPPPGSVFVEFDVPAIQLRINDVGKGWGRVYGPGSLEARLAGKKGLPVPTEMPTATGIRHH